MLDSLPNSSSSTDSNLTKPSSEFSSPPPSSYYTSPPYSSYQYYSTNVNNSYLTDQVSYSQATRPATSLVYPPPPTYDPTYYNYYSQNYYNYDQSYYNQDYYNTVQLQQNGTGYSNPQITVPSVSPSSASSSSLLSSESSAELEASKIVARPKCGKKKSNGKVDLPLSLNISEKSNDPGSIGISLTNTSLWERFSKHANEMIITKQGRLVLEIKSL